MLADMTVSELLENTAAGTPVPGGGSLSAMAAAVGAALSQMVAGLTAGRKAFTAVTPEMNELAEKARRLRTDLLTDMDRDAAAYTAVMEAFRLPREYSGRKKPPDGSDPAGHPRGQPAYRWRWPKKRWT